MKTEARPRADEGSLKPWQFVVGILLCVVPPFLFAIWSLVGAVMLRAAYSLCISRSEVPSFAKAWWVSLLVALATLPLQVANIVLQVSFPGLRLLFGLAGLPLAALVFAIGYRVTLRVTFAQGMLLWLIQLLMIGALYLVVFVAIAAFLSVG